ncbi:hypothetical protein V2W45_1472924 [Cenococcum geophilum]
MAKKKRELSDYNATVLRIEAALKELRAVPNPNILQYARLNRAYKGGKDCKTRSKINALLTEEQDYSLLRYIDFIDDIGFGQCDAILAALYTGAGSPPHYGRKLTQQPEAIQKWFNKLGIFIPYLNNRDGVAIAPMVIIIDLPDDYLMHKSETGYNNDETSLDWIKHFNKIT